MARRINDTMEKKTVRANTARKAPKADVTKCISKQASDFQQYRDIGLPPFRLCYYPCYQAPPDIERVRGFTLAQLVDMFELYWSYPSNTTVHQFCAAVGKCKSFADRHPPKPIQLRKLLMEPGMRAYFPWAWRERRFTLESYHLVNTLLTTSRLSSLEAIRYRLQTELGSCPPTNSFREAARGKWITETERYPFVQALPFRKQSFVLQPLGEARCFEYDVRGRLRLNRYLAEHVIKLAKDPRVRYDWKKHDFVRFVAETLDIPFNVSALNRLNQSKWPGSKKVNSGDKSIGGNADTAPGLMVPTWESIRRGPPLERLCRRIHELHQEGITKLTDVLDKIHEQDGYPLYEPSLVSHWRKRFPQIPRFRKHHIETSLAAANALANAIDEYPNKTYVAVGVSLGHDRRETARLLKLLRRHEPDRLPAAIGNRYSPENLEVMRCALNTVPLGGTLEDLITCVERENPDFFQTHSPNPASLRATLLRHFGIKYSKRKSPFSISSS